MRGAYLEGEGESSHSQPKEVAAINTFTDGKVVASKQEEADSEPAHFARDGDGRPQPVPVALAHSLVSLDVAATRHGRASHLFEPGDADLFDQHEVFWLGL